MVTKPGEKRKLYFDYNVVSEATTTSPFTTMDMDVYRSQANSMVGLSPKEATKKNWAFVSDDPDMPMFAAATRQYLNVGLAFKYFTPEYVASLSETLDPYLTATLRSKDCDRQKYRVSKLPPGITFRSAWKFLKDIPLWGMYLT